MDGEGAGHHGRVVALASRHAPGFVGTRYVSSRPELPIRSTAGSLRLSGIEERRCSDSLRNRSLSRSPCCRARRAGHSRKSQALICTAYGPLREGHRPHSHRPHRRRGPVPGDECAKVSFRDRSRHPTLIPPPFMLHRAGSHQPGSSPIPSFQIRSVKALRRVDPGGPSFERVVHEITQITRERGGDSSSVLVETAHIQSGPNGQHGACGAGPSTGRRLVTVRPLGAFEPDRPGRTRKEGRIDAQRNPETWHVLVPAFFRLLAEHGIA